MPKKVWQTDDGTLFNSESEAIKCEESDALFRKFYDQNGRRKELIEDISNLRNNFGSQISARLMQMFLKEFGSLQSAISEIDGLNELKNRLKDMRESMWLFPDE